VHYVPTDKLNSSIRIRQILKVKIDQLCNITSSLHVGIEV